MAFTIDLPKSTSLVTIQRTSMVPIKPNRTAPIQSDKKPTEWDNGNLHVFINASAIAAAASGLFFGLSCSEAIREAAVFLQHPESVSHVRLAANVVGFVVGAVSGLGATIFKVGVFDHMRPLNTKTTQLSEETKAIATCTIRRSFNKLAFVGCGSAGFGVGTSAWTLLNAASGVGLNFTKIGFTAAALGLCVYGVSVTVRAYHTMGRTFQQYPPYN